MHDTPNFHAGERFMQHSAGVAVQADLLAGLLSDSVTTGARPFIARQSMVALGSTDAAGRPWASLVFGKPGFATAPDDGTIVIAVPDRERDEADPLWTNLAAQADLGMLFLEYGSRRRYRVNGTVRQLDDRGITVAVREAFPNCPRFIRQRQLRVLGEPALPVQAAHGTVLRGSVADIVDQAGTLFVASRHAEAGADVSHRGGNPGFVRRIGDTTLRIPDYAGNNLFNTLGNLTVDPRAGLCIPDFEHGQLLQLTGTATVLQGQADALEETGGTGRYWDFEVKEWVLRDMAQQVRWEEAAA